MWRPKGTEHLERTVDVLGAKAMVGRMMVGGHGVIWTWGIGAAVVIETIAVGAVVVVFEI